MTITFGSTQAQAIVKKNRELDKLEGRLDLPRMKRELAEAIDILDQAVADVDHWQYEISRLKQNIKDLAA